MVNAFLGTIGSFGISCDDMHFEIGYWLLGCGS